MLLMFGVFGLCSPPRAYAVSIRPSRAVKRTQEIRTG